MKLSGMAGQGSGKLGSQVYASVSGEQIVRTYQSKVSNPNTSLQVNQRARMKLMSQLSAVFGPVLAYKKNKLVSARNQFVKNNFDISYGNDGQAQITLDNIQLTSGSAGLPGIKATRQGGTILAIELLADASYTVNRVVYTIFKKTGQAQLQLVTSFVQTEASATGTFPATTADVAGDLVIYAYGMSDLSANATAKYGNYNVESGEDIAKLVMSRAMSFSDYRFTRTRGCQLFMNETETQSVGMNQSRVFLTPSGDGVVRGAGIYDNGDEVTIFANANEGSEFVGWMSNRTKEFVEYAPTYKFTANGLVDLIAVFNNPESSTGGLDGEELTNPLPFADAELVVDDNNYSIATGQVNLPGSFDNMLISGLGTSDTLTFVPAGSTLGAADNIAFDDAGLPDGSYQIQQSGTGSGCIYFNGIAWFYVTCLDVEIPGDASIFADGSAVTITDNAIEIPADTDYLSIEDVEQGHNIVLVPTGSFLGAEDNVPLVYTNNEYKNEDTGSIVPGIIFFDNAQWLEVKASSYNPLAPVENAVLKINDGVVQIVNGKVEAHGLDSILTIENVEEGVNISVTDSGETESVSATYENGIYTLPSFGMLPGQSPYNVTCNGEHWFNYDM